MKPQLPAPDSWRSLDDLALSIRIARAARTAAQAAGREFDTMLEAVAGGSPPTAERLLETKQRWFDARALADASNEAFVRTRAREEEARRRAHDLAMPSLRPSERTSVRPSAGPQSGPGVASQGVDRSAMTQRSARSSWAPVEARAASPPRPQARARDTERVDPHTQN
jgi:hypothetical protein